MAKRRLYDALGLDPTAPADAIKPAYRKRVKDVHPDKGGKPEEFALVKLAYDVLGDAERRKRYDDTGDETGAEPDNTMSRIYQVIGGSLMKIVEQATTKNVDMATLDLCNILSQMIAGDLAQLRGLLDGNRAAVKKLQRIQKRFRKKKKDGSNHLEIVVMGHIQMFQRGIESGEMDVAAHEAALAIIKDHTFSMDLSMAFFRSGSSSSTTMGSF